MKVIAFAASTSKKSINKQLVSYAVSLLEGSGTQVLDLNDYALPLFSADLEEELGQPQLAQDFFQIIGDSDAVVISFAEHNGSYTAAYKNLFDWCSRIDTKVYQGKPVVLLSTSPGPGGAARVLAQARDSAPFFGAKVCASMSVPEFYDNFDVDAQQLSNAQLNAQLLETMVLLG